MKNCFNFNDVKSNIYIAGGLVAVAEGDATFGGYRTSDRVGNYGNVHVTKYDGGKGYL